MNKSLVRKPDAGKLHARFDERDVETEHGEASEAPRNRKGAATGYGPSLKPPRHISTLRARRVKVLVFSGCKSRPATGSLQPGAIGAMVEVTKPSEPSRQMCRFGDAASRQAVTRSER